MIVSWMTTNKCNLNCEHCYQDAGSEKKGELSTLEAMQLIDGIVEAGFRIMIFSGGEPLMRKDIYDLVAYAANKGLRPVFGTNGTLITAEAAERLKASGTAAMGISLDSLDSQKHNAFRGYPAAFEKTIEGMANCKKAGLPFQVHTTVMDWNENEVGDITDFAVATGAMAHYIFFLIPVGRGKIISETAIEVTAYERLLKKLMEKQKEVPIEIKPTCAPQFMRVAKEMNVPNRFARGCIAGLSYCIVSPAGIVRPCAYMMQEAGNIRENSFSEIWESSPLFRLLRTKQYKGACQACDYKDICGGCRARAEYYNEGDFMAEDSYCAYISQNEGLL